MPETVDKMEVLKDYLRFKVQNCQELDTRVKHLEKINADLLAACKKLMRIGGGVIGNRANNLAYDQAEKAIAKAESD